MNLNLESTASAKAKPPASFEHPTATNLSAVGGTDPVAQHPFEVAPGRGTASEGLVEVHPNDSLLGAAGGPAELLAGAPTVAIQPSFDSTAASWTSPDPNSNASALAKLLQSVTVAISTGLDSAARSAASVSEDLSSSSLPVCVEPHKKLIDWAMTLCLLWSAPQLVTHHSMTGPNEPSDPWEDFHLDAI